MTQSHYQDRFLIMYYDTFLYPAFCCCHSVSLSSLHSFIIKMTLPHPPPHWGLLFNVQILSQPLNIFTITCSLLAPTSPFFPIGKAAPQTWGLRLAWPCNVKWTLHTKSACMVRLCPSELPPLSALRTACSNSVAAPSTRPQNKTCGVQTRRAEPRRAARDWDLRKVFCIKSLKSEGYMLLQQKLFHYVIRATLLYPS